MWLALSGMKQAALGLNNRPLTGQTDDGGMGSIAQFI
jgi:hypothetical protein